MPDLFNNSGPTLSEMTLTNFCIQWLPAVAMPTGCAKPTPSSMTAAAFLPSRRLRHHCRLAFLGSATAALSPSATALALCFLLLLAQGIGLDEGPAKACIFCQCLLRPLQCKPLNFWAHLDFFFSVFLSLSAFRNSFGNSTTAHLAVGGRSIHLSSSVSSAKMSSLKSNTGSSGPGSLG